MPKMRLRRTPLESLQCCPDPLTGFGEAAENGSEGKGRRGGENRREERATETVYF